GSACITMARCAKLLSICWIRRQAISDFSVHTREAWMSDSRKISPGRPIPPEVLSKQNALLCENYTFAVGISVKTLAMTVQLSGRANFQRTARQGRVWLNGRKCLMRTTALEHWSTTP